MKYFLNKHGITLIEVMIAVSVIGVALIPVTGMMGTSLRRTVATGDEIKATEFAGNIMKSLLNNVLYDDIKSTDAGMILDSDDNKAMIKEINGDKDEKEANIEYFRGTKFTFKLEVKEKQNSDLIFSYFIPPVVPISYKDKIAVPFSELQESWATPKEEIKTTVDKLLKKKTETQMKELKLTIIWKKPHFKEDSSFTLVAYKTRLIDEKIDYESAKDEITEPEEKPIVKGCTDPKAENYNKNATNDDGSCKYPPKPPTQGCMDPQALNYDPKATVQGVCKYPPLALSSDSLFGSGSSTVSNPAVLKQLAATLNEQRERAGGAVPKVKFSGHCDNAHASKCRNTDGTYNVQCEQQYSMELSTARADSSAEIVKQELIKLGWSETDANTATSSRVGVGTKFATTEDGVGCATDRIVSVEYID